MLKKSPASAIRTQATAATATAPYALQTRVLHTLIN